ncbi:MAG TPA: DNA-binding domain-containing protein [Pirellulales bacterium]|jgi:hypothetical protein|nr:DNA-binding domain-containing protein [Pirellulales bacterium]
MKPLAPKLAEVERWMQSVIMHPGGVAEGIASDEARRHLDVGAGELEAVINRSRDLTAEERLEIYVDAYHERLLECLAEEFAATRGALGDDLFHAVAFGYLESHPSRSYTLHALGANFPQYLEETRLHECAPPPAAPPDWGEIVVEIARFERLERDVFDGPGTEREGTLDEQGLAKIASADWGTLRFVPAPCLRLCQFAHPVHEWARAFRRDEQTLPFESRDVRLAISRRDYVVAVAELAPAEHQLLGALVAGRPLGQALDSLVASGAVLDPALESELGSWFAAWARAGYFVRVG